MRVQTGLDERRKKGSLDTDTENGGFVSDPDTDTHLGPGSCLRPGVVDFGAQAGLGSEAGCGTRFPLRRALPLHPPHSTEHRSVLLLNRVCESDSV